jgi:hypothetical protein
VEKPIAVNKYDIRVSVCVAMHLLIIHSGAKYSEENIMSIFRVEEGGKIRINIRRWRRRRHGRFIPVSFWPLHSPSLLKLDTTVSS